MSRRIGLRGPLFAAALALAVTAVAAGDRGKCTRPVAECAARTKEMYQTRGWMGVELEQNEDGSLRITSVEDHGPAAKAGIRRDDTLVSVNGATLSTDTLESAMTRGDAWKIGGVLVLGVRRGSETSTVKVTLEKIPDTLLARIIEIHAREYHSIARN